jgi:hypothetical protein
LKEFPGPTKYCHLKSQNNRTTPNAAATQGHARRGTARPMNILAFSNALLFMVSALLSPN